MIEITLTTEQRAVLQGYRQEAEKALEDALVAKNTLKDIVAASAEKTHLPKRLIAKFYKAKFNSKLEDVLEEAKQLEFLDEE